ncbi:MAG: isochorismatase family protein, partial [Verrucomicrobiales bacterium]|nr:isochorismatase family protein [Verrucomicrobiales bacterium]
MPPRPLTLLVSLLTMSAQAAPFSLDLRQRPADQQNPAPTTQQADWNPAETAFVICDMWDSHHSVTAVRRVNEFAPRLNRVLAHARSRGATIVHSPSDCMDAYADHPARENALATPTAPGTHADIATWCHRIPTEQAARYPIDQSDGGEDESPWENDQWTATLKTQGRNPGTPWLRQNALLDITGSDFIAAEGDIVWNVLHARGIKHVVLAGVHTNMCVLGRPFGLRRMVAAGMDTVLLRDATDVMYNPARWPYVSHFTGIDLVIEHIETHVCPTITTDQFIGGTPFQFKHDRRPRLAILAPPESTLRTFAHDYLGQEFSVDFVATPQTDVILQLTATTKHVPNAHLITLNTPPSAPSFTRSIRPDAGRLATSARGTPDDLADPEFKLALLNTIRWSADLAPLEALPETPDSRRIRESWSPATLTDLPQSDSLWLRTLIPAAPSPPPSFTWPSA